MSKGFKTKINIDVFSKTLNFYIGEDMLKSYIKDAKKIYDIDIQVSKHSDGNTYGYLVWLREEDFPLLVHETVHALMNMFSDIGVSVQNDDGEVFAYTIQYVVHEVMRKKEEQKR